MTEIHKEQSTRPRDDAHDEWLVVRCQLGEREAFDPLIARWHLPLCRYASRVGGNQDAVGDIVQDVWLRVVRGLPSLRDPSRFRPWLFGIARRVLMDRLRIRYAEPRFEELEDAAQTDLTDPNREFDVATMSDELAALPATEREVLALFYLDELTLAEVADVTGVPAGTVKSRLHRARRLLRDALSRRGVRS